MGTRKATLWVAIGLASALAVAAAVWASPVDVVGGSDTYDPNRTKVVWSTQDSQTSSQDYKNVNGLGDKGIKHFGTMIATYTVKIEGGPAQFRVSTSKFNPLTATFNPSSGTDTFSFTAVLQSGEWRCSDPSLKWRSTTGVPVTLSYVGVVAEYKRKSEEPDFGCI